MRFIMIRTQNNEDVAVNASNITSIQRMNGGVVSEGKGILLSDAECIYGKKIIKYNVDV